MSTNIGDIIDTVPCVFPDEKNKTIDKLFMGSSELQGIVVVNQKKPVALIPRTHFYQKIGTLYGYNLYMGRAVELTAKKDPLIVDYLQPITEVSQLAMERDVEDLYDYVIVTKEENYIGTVSIQKLLMRLVEIQVEFASFLNPLTQLPGNRTIERKLKEVLQESRYSIIYFDLDHFKTYNDNYGFKKGDEMLKAFAKLLRKYLLPEGYFLGHIGGDDFIAIQKHYDTQHTCNKIIKEFHHILQDYYSAQHFTQKYILSENRSANVEKIPLVSISVAIVTNQTKVYKSVEELVEHMALLKKRCKAIKGGCCIVD